MKVPGYDEIVDINVPYSSADKPIVIERYGHSFNVWPGGYTGSRIDTQLPDGWTLFVHVSCDPGPSYKIVGRIQRKTSFGVALRAPGADTYDRAELASKLSDTTELARSDARLAKLAPLVEECFAALLAAAPLAAAITAVSKAKPAEDAQKLLRERAEAQAALARFVKK